MKLTYEDFSYHLGSIYGTLENKKVWIDMMNHGIIKPETLRELKRIVRKASEELLEGLNKNESH